MISADWKSFITGAHSYWCPSISINFIMPWWRSTLLMYQMQSGWQRYKALVSYVLTYLLHYNQPIWWEVEREKCGNHNYEVEDAAVIDVAASIITRESQKSILSVKTHQRTKLGGQDLWQRVSLTDEKGDLLIQTCWLSHVSLFLKKTLMTHTSPLPENPEPQQQLEDAPKILCTPYIRGLS